MQTRSSPAATDATAASGVSDQSVLRAGLIKLIEWHCWGNHDAEVANADGCADEIIKFLKTGRNVDACGGTASNDYNSGYCYGIDRVLSELEACVFTENQSTAADKIDALVKALADLLAASERHIFSTECQIERDAARAALAGAKQ